MKRVLIISSLIVCSTLLLTVRGSAQSITISPSQSTFCFNPILGNTSELQFTLMEQPQQCPSDGEYYQSYVSSIDRWEIIPNIGIEYKLPIEATHNHPNGPYTSIRGIRVKFASNAPRIQYAVRVQWSLKDSPCNGNTTPNVTVDVKDAVTPTVSVSSSITPLNGRVRVCSGTGVQFIATPNPLGLTNTPTYTWSRNAGGNWQDVVGQNGSTYTANNYSDEEKVRVKVNYFGCSNESAWSNEMTVDILQTPEAIIHANMGENICQGMGNSFSLQGAYSWPDVFTVEWQVNGNGAPQHQTPPENYPYQLVYNTWPYAASEGPKQVRAIIHPNSQACPNYTNVYSNVLTIAVVSPPAFLVNFTPMPSRQSMTYCPGEVYFKATTSPTSASATFNWYKNGEMMGSGVEYHPGSLSDTDIIKLDGFATAGQCLDDNFDTITKTVSTIGSAPYLMHILPPSATVSNITLNSYDNDPNNNIQSPNKRCQGGGWSKFASDAAGYFPEQPPVWSIKENGVSSPLQNSIDQLGVITWHPNFSGSVEVKVIATGCSGPQLTLRTITVNPTVPVPTVSVVKLGGDPTFVCPGASASFSATSSALAPVYTWKKDGTTTITTDPAPEGQPPILPSGFYKAAWPFPDHYVDISVKVLDNRECNQGEGTSNTIRVWQTLGGITLTPSMLWRCQGDNVPATITASETRTTYNWVRENAGNSYINPQTGVIETWDQSIPTQTDLAHNVKIYATAQNCPLIKTEPTFIRIDPQPTLPPNITESICNWEQVVLTSPKQWEARLRWFDPALPNQPITANEVVVGPKAEPGVYTYEFETFFPSGCKSAGRGTATVTITDDCDDKLNTIETISFNQNETVVTNAKSYFDYRGGLLQEQSKMFSGPKVLISQSAKDKLNRAVISTPAAPGPRTDFRYKVDFIRVEDSRPFPVFHYTDINSGTIPGNDKYETPLDNITPGTVGAYYGPANEDPHVPRSQHPYGRTEFYDDGSSEALRAIGIGAAFRNAAVDNYVYTGTFPVSNELKAYFKIRDQYLGITGTDPMLFAGGATQKVVRDEHGKFGVVIADRAGNTIMSARNGKQSSHHLKVEKFYDGTAGTAAVPYYFYLFEQTNITIGGGATTKVLTNMMSGGNVGIAPSGPTTLPAGFYRIKYANGALSLNYDIYYNDVSLQFFNEAGKLQSVLTPNGFVQVHVDSLPYGESDHREYQYNHQGWLVKSIEPDGGTSEYLYRKDGKVRYSRNTKQVANNSFSYTHYDEVGAPVESGEFVNPQIPVLGFRSTEMLAELEMTSKQIDALPRWNVSNRTSWVKSHYDEPGGIPGFTQNYIAGAVSWTENQNNATYFSYDELGRVTAIVQRPKPLQVSTVVTINLNKSFITEYTYDFLGRVIQSKSYNTDTQGAHDQFFHHFTYDADSRLSVVETSTNGTERTQHALYKYYVHGPLKRIELGDKVQGIDFVYNINGWLTQINHPDYDEDPGNDGLVNGFKQDVFGMVIDYYESMLRDLFPVSSIQNSIDPFQFHKIPFYERDKKGYAGTTPTFQDEMKQNLERMKKLKDG